MDFGNVLANVDAIKTARLRQDLYARQQAEDERQAKREQDLTTARGAAWSSNGSNVGQLAALDPQEAVSVKNYFDGLGEKRRQVELDAAQAKAGEIGKAFAWLEAQPDPAAAWSSVRANIPGGEHMPEQYDPRFVGMTVARFQDMSTLLTDIGRAKGQRAISAAFDPGTPPSAPAIAGPGPGAPVPGPQQGNTGPSQNARFAFSRLVNEHGIPPEIAAGAVGNWQQESGSELNPNAFNPNETAFGIGQWRGDRLANLQRFAHAQGADPRDLGTQVDFFAHEIQTTESAAGQRIAAARTPAEAAALVDQYYERSDGRSTDRRAANAEALYAAGGATEGTPGGALSGMDPQLAALIQLQGSLSDTNQQKAVQTTIDLLKGQKTPEQPSSVQEYQFAQSQGETRPYTQWLMETKKAGAQNISIGGDNLPKTSPGVVNVPNPDGTWSQAPVAGGTQTQIPAELAGRIALAEDSLKQLPGMIKKAQSGDLTGPLDWLRGRAGYGAQGSARRDDLAAAESITRMLTGAGMNAAEAEREKDLYIIGLLDTPQSAADKLTQLQRRLTGLVASAKEGRVGVNIDANTGFGIPRPPQAAPAAPQVPPEILQQLQGAPAGTRVHGQNGEILEWDGQSLSPVQ